MVTYFFLFIFLITSLSGNSLNSLEITFYPEYYYSGIMLQVKGEAENELIGKSFDFSIPANIDSAFLFHSVSENEPDFIKLFPQKKKGEDWVNISVIQKRFAFFIFYNPLDLSKSGRSFEYKIKSSVGILNLHLTFQEPLGSREFIITEKNSTVMSDQHGFTFHEVHLLEIKAYEERIISGSYQKTETRTSMELLSSILQNEEKIESNNTIRQEIPLRHRLPLWEPLAVLGGLSIIIGFLYFRSNKKGSIDHQEFCTQCGTELKVKDNFCSKCGRKRN